jgi:hypothetical protein
MPIIDDILAGTTGYLEGRAIADVRSLRNIELQRMQMEFDAMSDEQKDRVLKATAARNRGQISPVGRLIFFAIFIVIVLFYFSANAANADTILRSLSPEVQKSIKETRDNCIRGFPTEGDDGLVAFTVSGKPAVLVDELNLCVDESHRGVNYATGFSHSVDIYVRDGACRKALTIDATDEIFFSVDEHNKFKNLVLSVHGGSRGCPLRDKSSPSAWKRESCDLHVKWDGAKFVSQTLGRR